MKYTARIKVKLAANEYRSLNAALAANIKADGVHSIERNRKEGIDSKGRVFEVTIYRLV